MRSGSFDVALTRHPLGCLAVTALTALLGGCSGTNEGNVTTPPPPGVLVQSAGFIDSGLKGDITASPSTGCGKPKPEGQADTIPGSRTGYTEYFVQQTGENLGTTDPSRAGPRQYFVRLPPDYNENTPYRVVYVGQGCGALHAGKSNTYALFDENYGGTDEAIYIGLSVPDNDANPGCYDNNTGKQSQEWEAFDKIQTQIEDQFCIDNNRIFVAGYSTGGWLSNMWGCYFAGLPTDPPRKFSPKWAVRAHANVTGSLPPNQPACNGPSAGIWIHDTLDKSNLIATNIAALEQNLISNDCTGNYKDGPKEPWAPAEEIPGLAGGKCQEYTGCSAEMRKNYPLVFCTTSGQGHSDQPKNAIPAFTKFFDLLNPVQ